MESRKQKQKTLTSFFSHSNISTSGDGEPGEHDNPSASVPTLSEAYYIVKNDRPYSDQFGLLELQQLNGVDIGVGLHSRYSAVEIINHISKEMKFTGKLSVIIDESTSSGATSTLIVYLKCEVSKELPPSFLDLLTCLNKHGFHNDYLRENLVVFASAGARVMFWKNSGVAKKLVTKYTNIVLWHCMNHRLELALSDAVDKVSGVNNFKIFMDKLYTLSNNSPKNQRQLAECAAQLNQQVKKIGKVLRTRWVASSFRTVSVVWHNFAFLYNHFSILKYDKSKGPTDRAMHSGLIRQLSYSQFFMDLAIMYDILAGIALLSESLQNRNIAVACADKLIRRCIIL
ncbi:hypothetical protein PR048_003352 [Dryococelus australis]|uniref:E3 SUMO-protein ligase KIAA1586-like n=1 Tax=Dryococelus australis TaxID=614101 RepID=A0ABQ9IMV2_9NEOP|nr:hypothetical protein PR048_003352 [Dryococelus australis]